MVMAVLESTAIWKMEGGAADGSNPQCNENTVKITKTLT